MANRILDFHCSILWVPAAGLAGIILTIIVYNLFRPQGTTGIHQGFLFLLKQFRMLMTSRDLPNQLNVIGMLWLGTQADDIWEPAFAEFEKRYYELLQRLPKSGLALLNIVYIFKTIHLAWQTSVIMKLEHETQDRILKIGGARGIKRGITAYRPDPDSAVVEETPPLSALPAQPIKSIVDRTRPATVPKHMSRKPMPRIQPSDETP